MLACGLAGGGFVAVGWLLGLYGRFEARELFWRCFPVTVCPLPAESEGLGDAGPGARRKASREASRLRSFGVSSRESSALVPVAGRFVG